jgi:hypothetical protein
VGQLRDFFVALNRPCVIPDWDDSEQSHHRNPRERGKRLFPVHPASFRLAMQTACQEIQNSNEIMFNADGSFSLSLIESQGR